MIQITSLQEVTQVTPNNEYVVLSITEEPTVVKSAQPWFVSPVETVFTVEGGTIGGTQPTFDGAPLFSGTYLRTGNLVNFQIQVDFSNITSFGSGQYFLKLPFAAKHAQMMRGGCLHDASSGKVHAIAGHAAADSDVLALWYTSTNGQDSEFTSNHPTGLTSADYFHVSGTYLAKIG